MKPDAYSDYSRSHKAYFMLKPDRPDDTGIGESPRAEADNTIYNLQGHKLKEVTSPGIYIINGKSRLVK